MSLLMQALKTAEQLKQKQLSSPAEESSKKEPELASTSDANAAPEIEPNTPYPSLPAISEAATNTHESAVTETKLDLPALELQLEVSKVEAALVHEEPELKQTAAKSPPVESQALALESVDDTPPSQTNPVAPELAKSIAAPEAPAAPLAMALVETSSEEQSDKTNKKDRSSTPRTGQERKQASAEAAERVSLEQKKAQSVFASKQTNHSRRRKLYLGVTLVFFIVCGAAGFYYVETTLQNIEMSTQSNSAPITAPNPVPTPAPTPASSTTAQQSATGPTSSTTSTASTTTTSAPPAPRPAPAAADKQTTTANRQALDVPSANVAATSNGPIPISSSTQIDKRTSNTLTTADVEPRERSAARPASPKSANAEQTEQTVQTKGTEEIRIHKGTTSETTNNNLTKAYQLFSSGNLDAARALYENVLRQDPNNRDALLGTAAIAMNQKQMSQAAAIYSRLLDLDPLDPEASAGLTSLRHGEPEQSESQLKKVLAQSPESGATLFELGNLYARQSRWADAQHLYFRAFGTAPGNADYAYNLAVSLDHLGQRKLALDYYQQAISLTEKTPGNFDRQGTKSRIDQLQQVVNMGK